MGRLASVVVVSILISGPVSGCGCLAPDSYGTNPACQKYNTHYDLDRIYREE
jgi:hypothetical protein